jgi:hypothetical protein
MLLLQLRRVAGEATDSGTPSGACGGLRVWVRVWVSGLGFGVSGSSMGTGPTGELGPATGRGVVVGCWQNNGPAHRGGRGGLVGLVTVESRNSGLEEWG